MSKIKVQYKEKTRTPHFIMLAIILGISSIMGVTIGSASIEFFDAINIISHHIFGTDLSPSISASADAIIWQLRMPRVILAILVGAGLSVVGATLQATMRNSLADPHLFGISSGSAFGAVSVILFFGSFAGFYSLTIGAFIGAIIALILVLSIANTKKQTISSERLLLAGIACSFLLVASTNLMIFMGEHRSTPSILFWMLGGLGFARWEQITIPAVILTITLSYIMLHAKHLNTIMSGEETAVSLGINTTKVRVIMFTMCALITGAIVATSGAIGFVGLMVPHITRLWFGANNITILPFCAIIGSIFLIWTDILARTMFAPQEIPIGILTALIGGVFFIILIRNKNV